MGNSYLTKPRRGPGGEQAAQGAVGKVVSIGMQLAIPAAIGAWIDFQFGTKPWCAAGGSILGFVLFFVGIVRLAQSSIPAGRRLDHSRSRTIGVVKTSDEGRESVPSQADRADESS